VRPSATLRVSPSFIISKLKTSVSAKNLPRRIILDRPSSPFFSANAVAGTRDMFLDNGFNDYLSKPIDTTVLNTILEKYIPKSKQIRLSQDNKSKQSTE